MLYNRVLAVVSWTQPASPRSKCTYSQLVTKQTQWKTRIAASLQQRSLPWHVVSLLLLPSSTAHLQSFRQPRAIRHLLGQEFFLGGPHDIIGQSYRQRHPNTATERQNPVHRRRQWRQLHVSRGRGRSRIGVGVKHGGRSGAAETSPSGARAGDRR